MIPVPWRHMYITSAFLALNWSMPYFGNGFEINLTANALAKWTRFLYQNAQINSPTMSLIIWSTNVNSTSRIYAGVVYLKPTWAQNTNWMNKSIDWSIMYKWEPHYKCIGRSKSWLKWVPQYPQMPQTSPPLPRAWTHSFTPTRVGTPTHATQSHPVNKSFIHPCMC